jgi:hypothetical protein
MHLGGDWVDTKRQRWGVPRRRGRVCSLSTVTIVAENFNADGVSRGALVRTMAKAVFCLLKTMFVVGRQAVRVSSCTNNNVYLTKANICREDKAAVLDLDPSSVGHSGKC